MTLFRYTYTCSTECFAGKYPRELYKCPLTHHGDEWGILGKFCSQIVTVTNETQYFSNIIRGQEEVLNLSLIQVSVSYLCG